MMAAVRKHGGSLGNAQGLENRNGVSARHGRQVGTEIPAEGVIRCSSVDFSRQGHVRSPAICHQDWVRSGHITRRLAKWWKRLMETEKRLAALEQFVEQQRVRL